MKTVEDHKAYLAGVYSSDGYINNNCFGLNVKDFDFADQFRKSICSISNYNPKIHKDKRSIHIIRVTNKKSIFNFVINYEPITNDEKRFWLRGFFDGDGNANISKVKKYNNSFCRRISFYNTELKLIIKANNYLYDLGMICTFKLMILSESHLGNKPVYELRLISGILNYTKFQKLISSTIERKRIIIDSIINSYDQLNLSERMKLNQKISAEIKRNNFLTVELNRILNDMKYLRYHHRLTIKNCSENIKGYYNALNYFKHSDLLKML